MFKTIFIERYSEFSSEIKVLKEEIKNHLKVEALNDLRIIHKFEIEFVSNEEMVDIQNQIFNDHISNVTFTENNFGTQFLEIEAVKGQFDFINQELETMVSQLLDRETNIKHSKIFVFNDISDADFKLITQYLLNPNESQLKENQAEEKIETINYQVPTVHFKNASEQELMKFKDAYALEMDDLKLIQNYFKEINREANELELRLIATYWSDHCRHTTFNTEITDLKVQGAYQELIENSLNEYKQTRQTLKHKKPFTLMDLACINAKEIQKKGLMNDWDLSKEVNAASIKVDISGEEYLLLFKNETHNHPTEIEPYGGASTCIGGCVRDPMSGRATVYQAMRITGSKNPNSSYLSKHPLKLSQRQIGQLAAQGYSDYANQMGVDTDYVKEYYHDGFEAKRMELGALLASVKSKNVQKLEPQTNDVILVIGGKTGRDGLGAAIGSSKKQSQESLKKSGPEVQKGDPVTERKLMRLFNNPEFTKLIKRSNDFGAGGLGVAVGELADGLDIYLDKMILKTPLDPMEIALSESQERMAVVIAKEDMIKIIHLAKEENLDTAYVADVKDTNKLRMFYKDQLVLDLDRSFLDENGAKKSIEVIINSKEVDIERDPINNENQEALREIFSNSNESNELLQDSMVKLIPNQENNKEICSFMSCGYNPYISNTSPYHAGYIAVVDAISKIVSRGGNPTGMRLSFQEYFESLHQDPIKWGKASAALLGAFQVMKELDTPSIGGKDSMSGTFTELSVPPSILCFAVQTGNINHTLNKEFKKVNSTIAMIKSNYTHETLMDLKAFEKNNLTLHELMKEKKILACASITSSIDQTLKEMSLINNIECDRLETNTINNTQFYPGSYIVEVEDIETLKDLPYEILGKTIKKDNKEQLNKSSEIYDTYHLSNWGETSKQELTKKDFNKTINEKANFIIPVFSGINQELTLHQTLNDLEITNTIHVLNESNIKEAIQNFCQKLKQHNVLFLSDGFKQVNDVYNSGLQYSLFLNNECIQKAIQDLQARGGLVIGSGAGALGLIKSEYFGKDIQVSPNHAHKHISKLIDVQCTSNQNCVTQNNTEDRKMRLDTYDTHIQNVNEAFIFLKSKQKLDNQMLNLGLHNKTGQVIASLCRLENDTQFLTDINKYFTTGRTQ